MYGIKSFLALGEEFLLRLKHTSFVIVQEHMGNSVNAEFVFTIATIGGAVSGIVFGKISDIFKRFTRTLGIGFMAACFMFLGLRKALYFIT